jgi:hypothetical protein
MTPKTKEEIQQAQNEKHLRSYLLDGEAPYFRSEPYKLVQTFTREEAEEGLDPDIIKFVDQNLNRDNFKHYCNYLSSYKETYDFIFSSLEDPAEKAGFKQKVCSTLSEPTKNPDYIYLEPVNDLLEQITKDYDLYKNGSKNGALSSEEQALKMAYENNANVTRENVGSSLYNKFIKWSKRENRIANDGSNLQLQNKIKRHENVISVLDDKFKPKAIDELKTLKSYLPKN